MGKTTYIRRMIVGEFETNKIYNRDCYEAIKKIPDKSIDCIYTDVPYLMDKHGYGHSELGQRLKEQSIELQEIVDGYDTTILDDFVRVLKRINIFIWCSKLQILETLNYFDRLGCRFEILVWKKDNPSPSANNTWLPDLEYCLYFRERGVRLNDGYNLKSKWYASATNKRDKDRFEHPTIKPVDLVSRHLLHATQADDIILDPFMGSGTTAVACIDTGRQYLGFEKDERWYKVAANRLQGIDANGQQTLFPM